MELYQDNSNLSSRQAGQSWAKRPGCAASFRVQEFLGFSGLGALGGVWLFFLFFLWGGGGGGGLWWLVYLST